MAENNLALVVRQQFNRTVDVRPVPGCSTGADYWCGNYLQVGAPHT